MPEQIEPVITEVAKYCLETAKKTKQYTDIALFYGSIIFMDLMMNKMFELIKTENIPQETAEAMAEKCGNEFRNLIKKYTNLDTHELAKKI